MRLVHILLFIVLFFISFLDAFILKRLFTSQAVMVMSYGRALRHSILYKFFTLLAMLIIIQVSNSLATVSLLTTVSLFIISLLAGGLFFYLIYKKYYQLKLISILKIFIVYLLAILAIMSLFHVNEVIIKIRGKEKMVSYCSNFDNLGQLCSLSTICTYSSCINSGCLALPSCQTKTVPIIYPNP
jgi:hypothetical protein